ncbi:MAG: hypothetical protein HWD58_08800 [Bacteroidota bacterium]|nr:MAG: hypothetical protein HWD58_08800 [Bacteroidota bacterium]
MAKTVEKTDWSSLSAILNTTITLIEQHVEVIEQVSKDIRIEGLEKDAERLAKKLEDSSAIQDLENSLINLRIPYSKQGRQIPANNVKP